MRLVGRYLKINNFITPSTRPSVSKAMFDVMDELTASVDVGINSSDALFTAAAVASCNDAYHLSPSDLVGSDDSIEAMWTALARSSSIDKGGISGALETLCTLITDRKDYTTVPPALVKTVKNLSLTTHTSQIVVASSTPISTLPDLIAILSSNVDDLPLAVEAYRHLNEQGRLLDKAIYMKLAGALLRADRHQDVLEMFDLHLRLSDELLAYHRDRNISKQMTANMMKNKAVQQTTVYHPGSRSTVTVEEPVDYGNEEEEVTTSIQSEDIAGVITHDRPFPMAPVDPEIINSAVPSLMHMGEVDVLMSLLLEEMPSRGIPPHVSSVISLLQTMYNGGRYTEVIDIFTKFWNDCVIETPKVKNGKRFIRKWKISRSQAEALVDIALKCCKEASSAHEALKIMVLWEQFTAHVSASDISVSSSDIRGRWYTMVSITLAKDKESFGMLPSLIESLKHSGSVPSRALLAACIKSCTEMGDAKMETQMRKLLLQCGYS